MTRGVAALFATAGIAGTVGGGPVVTAGDGPQVFRAAADATSVHVVVRDRNRPVAGLAAEDFVLEDNGVRQRVEAVSAASLPIDVTVILDSSGSVAGSPARQLQRDVDALTALLAPDDQVRVLSVSTTVTEIMAMQPAGATPSLAPPAPGGATAYFHALIAALWRPATPGRPHLIVALGDGGDNVSLLDARDAKEIAQRSEGVLQIVIRGRPGGRGMGWLPFAGPGDLDRVEDIAQATGGRLTRVPADRSVAELLSRAVADFKTGYVLWFTPTGVPIAGWHDLRVRIAGRNHTVIARRGYFGG
jgi:hypothetical protein